MSWVFLIITVAVLGVIAFRWPPWTVVLLSVSVALDIACLLYPQPGSMGEGEYVVTLARLASAAVMLAGLYVLSRHMRDHNMPMVRCRLRMIFFSPFTLVILGFWLYGVIGVVYSADGQATLTESLRWGVLMAVFAAAAYMLEKKDIPRILKSVHIIGLVLAPLAFAEKLTGHLVWQSERLMVEETLRVNTTFVDPNIYARYLVIAIVANLVLQRLCEARRERVLYWLALSVLLAQLVLTGSRGGMVTLVVVLILALICLPRRRELAVLMGGVGIGGVLVLWQRPELWKRIMEIGDLFTGTWSPRRYLIEAGVQIFNDHIVFGTGLGSFPRVLMEQYSEIKTLADGPVRSHTTVLTIAAEQGVIGLLFLAALLIVAVYMLVCLHPRRALAEANKKSSYILGVGCLLWMAAVFVSSQAEGRLFEDPIFWLAAAMLVVLNRERIIAG